MGVDEVPAPDLPRNVPLVFELQATCAVAKPGLPHEPGDPSEPAPRKEREIWLEDGPRRVPVYGREDLHAGASTRGPALVEAADTTYLIPEGAVCSVHSSGSAIIEEA